MEIDNRPKIQRSRSGSRPGPFGSAPNFSLARPPSTFREQHFVDVRFREVQVVAGTRHRVFQRNRDIELARENVVLAELSSEPIAGVPSQS